jgi:hypothetical protein
VDVSVVLSWLELNGAAIGDVSHEPIVVTLRGRQCYFGPLGFLDLWEFGSTCPTSCTVP